MQSQQAATSQNLHALLPSYNRPSLPSELVSLSQSLHALSRSRASTLKPDEEIARGFACCHLACERLKQKLNLPLIVARPPCGPRIYKKLYQFLEKALPEQMPTTPRKPATNYDALAGTPKTHMPRTPASAAQATPPGAYVDARSQPATPTPLRNAMLPADSMPERRKRRMEDGGGVLASLKKRPDAPDWLHGATQYLAKKFGWHAAAPYVYQGVCDVSKGKRYEEEEMASLVVAVLLSVLSKVGRLEDLDGSYMRGVTEMVALKRVKISRMGAVVTDVEKWIEEEAQNWTAMSWWESVPVIEEEEEAEEVADASQLSEAPVQDVPSRALSDDEPMMPREAQMQRISPVKSKTQPQKSLRLPQPPKPVPVPQPEQLEDDQEMEDVDFDEQLDAEEQASPEHRVKRVRIGAARGGLGTMIQSANDWLSEERRAEYATWKAQIMRKIEAAERRQRATAV